MKPRDSKNQMANRKNKNVILLWNLVILWGLTHDCGALGSGNDVIIHFFLSIVSSVLLWSVSRKELLPFQLFFDRSAFLPLLNEIPWLWWSQWPPLCESAGITAFILTVLLVGGWSQLPQVERRQRGCEYSTPAAWAPTWSGAMVLWQ